MLLSRKWLNEFVELPMSEVGAHDFAEAMTISGSKVEVTTDPGAEIKNVVVGQVKEITRHTNSDHMWICQIDVGEEELVQIVTGAQNVKAGDFVPVAKHNSYLPGGIHITKGKLRGEKSNGMLCSVKELNVTVHDFPYAIEDGILILSDDPELKDTLTPGQDIKPILGADDSLVEFEITPNRPDCLCMMGLAREAAVTFNKSLKLHTPVVKAEAGDDINKYASVTIDDADLCPRYTARLVKNVKIAPSPLWMRERLRAAGMRSINNIVDITNYVMLELGQPMHAFDFSCVDGGHIIVRRAKEGESLTTIEGVTRELNPSMLVIADENKPVAVAGIKGGANSEIVGDTAMVLFESANFNGPTTRRTAAALGMRTDASARFEKGLDVENTMLAVQRACELVELLGVGEVVEGIIDVMPNKREATKLMLEPAKINALLGTDISKEEMIGYLLQLGFTVEGDEITVPSWRTDVEHYSDIAEEVARFFGYNNIPNQMAPAGVSAGGYTEKQKFEMELGAACRACGYDEIITYSFISPNYYNKINLPENSPKRDSYKILNPLGEDTSIMRTTTLPSMLEIIARNYNYRNKSAKLYEIGKIYLKQENEFLAKEPRILSLGAYGSDMDFFNMKGVIETLFEQFHTEDVWFEAETTNPSYHPGRCAKVFAQGKEIGVFGQIHPAVAANYGVDAEIYCAELSFEAMLEVKGGLPVYRPLPKFPASTRDIAVVCDAAIPVAKLIKCIKDSGCNCLECCDLFDVYQGKGVAEGKKSVAFNLTLRAEDRSLTGEEAEAAVKKILTALEAEYNAVLR
ncbi:MAG: phenylalanine--tRNA ligase subunit beta [Oscillospiraceae bacterium]|nr:phenylalanine--tRNA ligase subunit beta [Oscillospiraceae bacterium]